MNRNERPVVRSIGAIAAGCPYARGRNESVTNPSLKGGGGLSLKKLNVLRKPMQSMNAHLRASGRLHKKESRG